MIQFGGHHLALNVTIAGEHGVLTPTLTGAQPDYDLCKLAQSSALDSSFARIDLLPDVVQFKERFYPSNWARYDLAKPGSFKLLPTNDAQLKRLERDYEDMQIMLFGTPPTFDSILEVLRQLEAKINSFASSR
jgi:hypothetical protein